MRRKKKKIKIKDEKIKIKNKSLNKICFNQSLNNVFRANECRAGDWKQYNIDFIKLIF